MAKMANNKTLHLLAFVTPLCASLWCACGHVCKELFKHWLCMGKLCEVRIMGFTGYRKQTKLVRIKWDELKYKIS